MSFDVDIAIRRGPARITTRFSASGGLTALFGPSGAGKTSILEAVAGLITPEHGRIRIDGETLFDSQLGIDLPPERRACGFVFQDVRLFPHKRVRDNLLYGRARARGDDGWMSLDEAANFLGIGHLLDRLPRTLSGGEAQRVAIGRALLSHPRFLLMDEPLSSIDLPRRAEIIPVIERVRDEIGLPILYVTHDPGEVERLAGEVVRIGGG